LEANEARPAGEPRFVTDVKKFVDVLQCGFLSFCKSSRLKPSASAEFRPTARASVDVFKGDVSFP
jgi:hypothetical protein